VNVDTKIGYQAIKAIVPLAEMFGYVTTLRTMTSGRATYSLEFSHYEPTPNDIKDNIIYKIKGYLVTV
jgi:elongation factor G